MMSSRFDPGSTSVQPQKPWTSLFYGSLNGPGFKTLLVSIKRNFVEKVAFYICEGMRVWVKEVYRSILLKVGACLMYLSGVELAIT